LSFYNLPEVLPGELLKGNFSTPRTSDCNIPCCALQLKRTVAFRNHS